MIDDIFISLDDLERVYRKNRRHIRTAAILGAVATFAFFFTRPPTYEAAATFKQSVPHGETSFNLKSFMRGFSGGVSEETTVPLILSRTVLSKVVEQLGLQAVAEPVSFQNITFDGKKPENFLLRFLQPNNFEILSPQKEVIGDGVIGKPVHLKSLTLTIASASPSVKIGKFYPMKVLPLHLTIDRIKKNCSIKPLRGEKNILSIKFTHPSSRIAAAVVNTIMEKYEEFLVEENKTIIGSQLSYLNQRQNELNDKLEIDLKEHVGLLKKNLQEQGFMGVQQEMKSILGPMKEYRERLDEIEIELAGLEKRLSDTALEPSGAKLANQFGQNLAEQLKDTTLLLQNLEREEPLKTSHETFAALIGDVENAKQLWKNSQEAALHQQYQEKRDRLAAYLQTFLHHLSSRQKNLEESTTYIDTLEVDFHGMTLEASHELFLKYCGKLDKLHTQLKQVIFFRDHLHEPHFEVSTLANVLKDTVTEELVKKSSKVEAQLCDTLNRSLKEQERLKETLSAQKRFLESHLSQTIELGKIRIQLIKEKIGSLHGVIKDLLQKEKEIFDYKVSQLKTNLQEIPELWQMEKQLDFKAQLTKGMMEGLTQIAESKNLSRHLYQVESRPIDTALEPLKPLPSYLLMKTLGGGIGSASLLYLFLLFQTFFRGLPLSLTTLRMMGAHTSGTLSSRSNTSFDELSHHDLETLRSMASFLLEKKGAVIALLGEQRSDFCFNLANLLSLHHKKIALIDCNFDKIVDPKDQPGLWHYLNQSADLPFHHEEKYDYLPSGGNTRHGVELLSSERFKHLLTQCRGQYDFVFLLRQAKLNSQDALQILNLSDLAIITTYEESQEPLKPYLHWSRQKDQPRATFTQYPI